MTNFRDGYLLRISNQSLRTTLLVVLGRRLSEAASQKTCLLVYIYFKFSRKDAKAVIDFFPSVPYSRMCTERQFVHARSSA